MSVETLSQLFDYITTNYNKPDLLVYRGNDGEFYKFSTNEFRDAVVQCALGLNAIGVKSGTKVILLSENRPEWHIVDFACHLAGAVLVPLFPSLIPEQIEYITNDSETEAVVVSNQEQANKIFEIKNNIKKVEHLIAFDEVTGNDVTRFTTVLQKGREQDDRGFVEKAVKSAKPEVIATLIYTSGTTGAPKGVMLSHRNFVSNVLACSKILRIQPSDLGLSFLPLSHSFERTVDYTYLYNGASLVYSTIDRVSQDLQDASPTIMAAVPRFYEKVKARIEAKAEEDGGLKKRIFDWAMKVGYEKADRQLSGQTLSPVLKLKSKIADKLVFSKIRVRTGGKMKYFISGGAPLNAEVGRFFYAAGLTILEGYGLTETSPVIAVNPYERPKFGTVGRVLDKVEVKWAPDGELLVRGPNVMMGYYKQPEATKEVMDGEWLRTGDVGMLDDEGYLKITDRKKQIIVTSVGKNVAPQPIEKEVELSPYIEQVVLIGDQRKFISALVVPDFDALQSFAAENGISVNGNEELVNHPKVLELIQKEIDEHQRDFSEYEQIQRFRLLPKPFTIENGQLTPTMKVKRKVVLQTYEDIIEEMYEENDSE